MHDAPIPEITFNLKFHRGYHKLGSAADDDYRKLYRPWWKHALPPRRKQFYGFNTFSPRTFQSLCIENSLSSCKTEYFCNNVAIIDTFNIDTFRLKVPPRFLAFEKQWEPVKKNKNQQAPLHCVNKRYIWGWKPPIFISLFRISLNSYQFVEIVKKAPPAGFIWL